MAKHLRNRQPDNPAWTLALDRYFLSAAYEKPEGDPLFAGPDDLPYYAFRSARSYDVEQIPLQEAMDNALHWATGGAVYPGGGVQEWIYSPGDLVSLVTCGTSVFQWQGFWGLDPVLADYQDGGGVSVGRPSPEFMSPLAARCLESILRRIYRAEDGLKDKVPSVAVLRPNARTKPEQASELLINAYVSDFASRERAEGFQTFVRRFLPSHLARRLITFDTQLVPEENFASLADLATEAGLQLVPEVETQAQSG